MVERIKRFYFTVDIRLRRLFSLLYIRVRHIILKVAQKPSPLGKAAERSPEAASRGRKRPFARPHLTRAQRGRVAYYAALALLLAILGSASHAYRSRREAAEAPLPSAQAALSARAEAALPTPEPTEEPIRWVWPLEGEIIGEYAPDAPVWSATLGQWQTHPALDIAGSPGEAVYACRDGVVADAWQDRLWGNVIVLDHGDGYQSTYAGLNTLNLVAAGQAVAAGDVISAVGPSLPCEADQPAHIHFQLTKDGEAADFEALAN